MPHSRYLVILFIRCWLTMEYDERRRKLDGNNTAMRKNDSRSKWKYPLFSALIYRMAYRHLLNTYSDEKYWHNTEIALGWLMFLCNWVHRRSQDFLLVALSSWPKIWWPFFTHHPLLHGHIRHILPPTTLLSHLRGCTSPNSAPILSLPWGVHLYPLHRAPPGYAYAGVSSRMYWASK